MVSWSPSIKSAWKWNWNGKAFRIVELKAVEKLADEHRAQLLNYLHATKFKLGILLNFGHYPKVEYIRMVL